ncbi:hypothetical protein N7539_005282 [Penicillium diatomitis]|uniref:Uncharacterized protein n=1 Tax=Penicillium diatomitis TaxID=2819901 RepID=A0A9X0BUL5_9EURO|nr:uncharacterized protein N7539_005282 [Penicillium diatomitis]KAJ5485294.1 hypothetical protein N7539_005282 [Penicillium diatomitis]
MMNTIFTVMILVGIARAQNAEIGLPTVDQQLSKGTDVIVQIQRPNTLTGSTEMALAIGISSCSAQECLSPVESMGEILYLGSFDPEYHEDSLPPYQNFTVTVPSDFAVGDAHINVAHATLVGASEAPLLQTLNRTVVVA